MDIKRQSKLLWTLLWCKATIVWKANKWWQKHQQKKTPNLSRTRRKPNLVKTCCTFSCIAWQIYVNCLNIISKILMIHRNQMHINSFLLQLFAHFCQHSTASICSLFWDLTSNTHYFLYMSNDMIYTYHKCSWTCRSSKSSGHFINNLNHCVCFWFLNHICDLEDYVVTESWLPLWWIVPRVHFFVDL